MDFTASAQELDRIYQTINSKNQSVIDQLISSILPGFSDGEEPLYDTWSVAQDLDNTNQYWLIAIGSVRYRQ